MAGAKKQTPAPIDRPLSRAYLREFSGWSTAYPPGISEPTSLRLMENVMINRDGSARVRPGLRYLSYDTAVGDPLSGERKIVGSHETFFLDDGSKAYLFAALVTPVVPDPPDYPRVDFFVAKYLDDPDVPFEVVQASSIFTLVADDVCFTSATTYVSYVQIDNKILALSNAGEPARLFFVGETKKAKALQALPGPGEVTTGPPQIADYVPLNTPQVGEPNNTWIDGDQDLPPTTLATATANTLISNSAAANTYQLAVFYSYSNEIGESELSDLATIRMQRPWSAWRWLEPNGSSEPDATQPTSDPRRCADQIVAWIPDTVHEDNTDAGATHLNIYAVSWSDQDPMPVEAVLVESKDLYYGGGLLETDKGRFVSITPAVPINSRTVPIPTKSNRRNYSEPPTAGQGLVAADRLILVFDPVNPAVIKWTTNEQGNYLDFTATRGGGYKTLTSGNLYIPACVKLWQNPQSTDTLTILCMGVDGRSNSYYMAPAQVASQSEATNVMGFEETTATPGTTSPYGVEVANNALFHPLDTQLMKSTAQNYNISHKSQTEQISDVWEGLADKEHIVSCLHEARLYYVVHNPDGETLEAGCWGNEIWVMDLAAKTPTWSRWLIQAQSLRTVEVLGRVYLGVVRPDGIYALDADRATDEYVAAGAVATRAIPWLLETNTQGANRAHDAWAHLQQVNIQVGFFQGQLRYGVRGRDLHGKPVDVAKIVRDTAAPGAQAWDLEDYLKIGRDMKEWFFYASSVEVDDVVQPSAGQINLVQYRYTPVSVNVGYEFGSVETFEYGRAGNAIDARTTDNGIPMPYIDTTRP